MKVRDPNSDITTFLEDAIANFECASADTVGFPIYSIKGNMFTGIYKQNIFLRLSEKDREKLYSQYEKTAIFDFPNLKRMDDLIILPESFYDHPEHFSKWLIRSYDYTKGLPSTEPEKKVSRFKNLKVPLATYFMCGLIFWAISTATVYPIFERGHETVMLDYQRCAAVDYMGYALYQEDLDCTQFQKTNPYRIVNKEKIYTAPIIGFDVTSPFSKTRSYYGHHSYWRDFSAKKEFVNYALKTLWIIPGWPISILT